MGLEKGGIWGRFLHAKYSRKIHQRKSEGTSPGRGEGDGLGIDHASQAEIHDS